MTIPALSPGRREICNGRDDDCDELVDDEDDSRDASSGETWYADGDGDGFGGASGATVLSCSQPSGYAAADDDCDDTDADISPRGLEDCEDGVDNNCDGVVDQYCAYTLDDAGAVIEGDRFSYFASAQALADIDGDGSEDLLLGAYYNDNVGAVYAFAGPITSGASLDYRDSFLQMDGDVSYDHFAYRIAGGDIDGDGYDDLIAAAPYTDPSGTALSLAGEAYVVYGPLTSDVGLSDADAVIRGSTDADYLGRYVLSVADLDGDDVDELVVGSYAYNSSTLTDAGALGGFSAPSGTLTLASADVLIEGAGSYSYVGFSMLAAGDLNGDGDDDFLYGEPGADRVYALSGPLSGTLGSGDADFAFTHEDSSADDRLGDDMTSGDFNGDGHLDLVIGSGYDEPDGSALSLTGSVAVFYGPITAGEDIDDADFITYGVDGSEFPGRSQYGDMDAGDIDGGRDG